MSTMTTKIGTKTWAEPGQAKSEDLSLEKNQTKLTAEQKKELGAENIGEVLNKVSDPKYVDPSKKLRGTGSNAMDKDAFFKLMMAQLKNQDPTSPLKNHEMAAQLAQFSSLEQLSNVNSTLKEMKAGNKPIEEFQALNLIGKKVSGDAARVAHTDIDKSHDFIFKLPQDAKTTEIKVVNAKGDTVREFKFNALKAGENKVAWNGETEDGRKAPAGDYHFETEAIAANGQKMSVKTDFEGVISGMSFSNEGPILQIGKQSIRLRDVRQFSDPSLMMNDQKAKDVTELDLKNSINNKQNGIKQETKTAAQKKAMTGSTEDVLADIGMSSELLGKLTKEVSKAHDKTADNPAEAAQQASSSSPSDTEQGAF